MATKEELGIALQKAHEAGDVEHARILAQAYQDADQPIKELKRQVVQGAKDVLGGAVRGAGSIGTTLLSAGDSYNELVGNKYALSSLDSTGDMRRKQIDGGLTSLIGSNPESLPYGLSKLASEIAGTAGMGGIVGKAAESLPYVSKLAQAIRTGGASGGNMMQRMAGGAISGAAQAGLANPDEAGYGAAIGGVLPPLFTGTFKVGEAVLSPFMGARNAARQAMKEMGENATVPSVPERGGKFSTIPEVIPTAGMLTDDPNLLKLEMNARVRNEGGKFYQRDAQNTANVYRALEKDALPDFEAQQMQDVLNARTGKLREDAFNAAKDNPVYREQLAKYLKDLGKTPGVRKSSALPIINRAKASLIMSPETVAKEAKEAALPWHQTGIDTQKDSLMTAITKLGGINKELAQSTYGNNIWEDIGNKGFNVFKNNGGHSLDDMATLLKEKGYLPEDASLHDLVDHLYYSNPKEMYSAAKVDYGHLDAPQSATDQLHSQLSDLISALNTKNAPKEPVKMVSKAMPEDIYQARKEIKDSLNLKTLTPDKLTNAAKTNRAIAMDVTGAMDSSLDDASGGAWKKYLDEHSLGMKPIEQGRAIQDVLDTFENSRKIFGTDVPQITPHALRKAIGKETYKNMGKQGYVSKVDDAARKKLVDAIKVMNAIENAKGGAVAVTGSPTASFATSLAQQGLAAATGSSLPMKAAGLWHALGVTRGQRVLDDALLNPEKLPAVIKALKNIQAPADKGLGGLIYKSAPVLGAQ